MAVKTWTKRDELQWLDASIEELGSRSYLGPWLREVRNDVSRSVGSDLPVSVMPSEAVETSRRLLAESKEAADGIITRARAYADSLRTKAQEDWQLAREQAALKLRRIADDLVKPY